MPGEPPNRLVGEIRFGASGNGRPHQIGRWSHGEDGFTWGLHPRCGVRFEGVPPHERLAVIVDLLPATPNPGRPPQRVEVRTRAGVVLEIAAATRIAFLADLGPTPPGGKVEVGFGFDALPHGVDGETRPLGAAFRCVRLLALGATSVPPPPMLPAGPAKAQSPREWLETITGMDAASFLTQFESLGNACDFGIHQRDLGADPLGLLRFGGVGTPGLMEALAERFDGLGAPGTLEAYARRDWNGEYCVSDRRYGSVSHTGLTPDQAAPEQVLAREAERMRFLRRLFLEVLDGALRIFVLRRPDPMHVAEALAVAEALRLSADNVTLWAVQEEGTPGAVDFPRPYLARGHLDVDGVRGAAGLLSWLSACTNAARAFGWPRAR